MIFSTFAEFKKGFKSKNFSQIYAIKNKPKLKTIILSTQDIPYLCIPFIKVNNER